MAINPHPTPPAAPYRASATGKVFGVIGCIIMGLGGLLWLLMSAGFALVNFEGRALAMLLAPLSVPLAVAPFLWAGRVDPRRFPYLGLAFVWGGLGAGLIANVLNAVSFKLVGCEETIVALGPFVEEAGKALLLFWLLFYRRRELTGVVDGIVYGGVIGAGFAYLENIDYYFMPFLGVGGDICAPAAVGTPPLFEDAVGDTFLTFFGRALLTPFTHPVLTAITGIGIGIAVVARGELLRFAAPIMALALAATLHGAFNFSVSMGADSTAFLLVAFTPWLVLVGILVYVYQLQRRDLEIISSRLPEFVSRGWIAREEIEAFRTVAGRKRALKATTARYGGPAAKRLHERQVAVTRLALLEARNPHGSELEAYRQHLILFLNLRRPLPAGRPVLQA